MRKLTASSFLAGLLIIMVFATPSAALAHRSGCHRWHSCPSDSGSYVCGDTGYCSQCPDNDYCLNGQPRPPALDSTPSAPAPVVPLTSPSTAFPRHTASEQSPYVGIPRTRVQLYQCAVVANGNSGIYHLKGSRYIRSMNVKGKKCFATEQEAINAGFRKAKAR